MMDVWTKKGPDGRTITFKKEGSEDVGFMYFVQGRTITETWTTQEEQTREQVEEHFTDYVNGSKPATGIV